MPPVLPAVDDIRFQHNGHLSTGIFGTKFMLEVLSCEGRANLASAIVNQNDYPSWGHMLESGATTLWENWQGGTNTFSHNHPMFGSVSEWFYRWLGGIQPAPDAAGFDRIIIRPQVVKEVDWVRCTYNSVRGRITSNWKRDGSRVKFEMEIPANTTALVYLPAKDFSQITEGGKPAPQVAGIRLERHEHGQVILHIGSGRYSFQVQNRR